MVVFLYVKIILELRYVGLILYFRLEEEFLDIFCIDLIFKDYRFVEEKNGKIF